MADETKIPPTVTSNHATNRPIRVVVVGAGGTGGRLIPGLMQVLKRGDTVAIVDGDHVEDRNLARQNFRQRDIGENKAEIMASRYTREGIRVDAHAVMLENRDLAEQVMRPPADANGPAPGHTPTIIIGCVDNWKARRVMQETLLAGQQRIWIDAGNERRGGQMLLSARSWPFKVQDHSIPRTADAGWNIPGLTTAMPQLLEPKPWHCHRCNIDNPAKVDICQVCKQPEASCGDRIDLQTVAVNQLSATTILNAVSTVLYKVPFSTCGAFFSTLNTMTSIPFETVDFARYEVRPSSQYADRQG